MAEHEINIRIADWHTDQDELSKIRRQVFIEEQRVPEALEWDEFDATSSHFIVTQHHQTIACARLKPDGQIGRMAVLTEHRNKGIGSKLLQFVIDSAAKQDIKQVFLHAQMTAVLFYERHEFIATGDIFFEANIPHRAMSRKIC